MDKRILGVLLSVTLVFGITHLFGRDNEALVAAGKKASLARVFNIRNGAPPEISIRVGSGGRNISRVDFLVPSADIGSGIPVDSNRKINIRLVIRAPAANPLTGFLTVDSSTPLDNGSWATIPASEISWTARSGDIPSGSFAGTSNQPLATSH